MKLNRLTERVWVFPYEEERDRPNLGYIRGDRWSLAADAGHSEAHVKEFYKALEEEGLPLPRITVLTHWHWDHTFGMHAVHGLCLATPGRTGICGMPGKSSEGRGRRPSCPWMKGSGRNTPEAARW